MRCPVTMLRALVLLTSAAATEGLNAEVGKDGLASEEEAGKVIQVYMYRGQSYSDAKGPGYDPENVNLADIVGSIQYIMREVIPEHTIADDERTARKYDISHILRFPIKIKNGDPILRNPPPPGLIPLYQKVDFGPFVTYDYGLATNPTDLERIEERGDYVGVAKQEPVDFVFDDPYYWFSLSGYCPKLPFRALPYRDEKQAVITTGLCNDQNPCPAKGDWKKMNSKCDTYKDKKQKVLGGLCRDKKGKLKTGLPTGDPGCTYVYDPDDYQAANLDELSTITEQDCGGRTCKNWKDFRDHCTSDEFKRRYDKRTKQIMNVTYCVEYDYHPACQDCGKPPKSLSEACLQVPEGERELGLPFWKGRCDGSENRRKVEALADMFKIEGATTKHKIVASDNAYAKVPCNRPPPAEQSCKPITVKHGGSFCTRSWAGVCEACRIANAAEKHPAVHLPLCPWDVVDGEYKELFAVCDKEKCCNSKEARDGCCLYTKSCNHMEVLKDGTSELPLDENGLAIVERLQDTDEMYNFFKRLAESLDVGSNVNKSSPIPLQKAYHQWGWSPKENYFEALEQLKEAITNGWSAGSAPTPEPTVKPTASPTSSPTKATPSPTPPPAPTPPPTPLPNSSDGGMSPLVPIAGIVIVIGAIAAIYFCVVRPQAPRPASGNSQERTPSFEMSESQANIGNTRL